MVLTLPNMHVTGRFPERLRLLRAQHRYSQETLAFRTGVSRLTIQSWESGKHYPSLVLAERLADLFDVTIDYLAGRDAATPEERMAQAAEVEAEDLLPPADPRSGTETEPRRRPRRAKPPAL